MEKTKAPKLVTVAIFTTITTVFWVFMGLYNIITSTPPINVDPKLLKPINPTLDREALIRLDERIFFEQGQTNSPVITKENLQPTPTASEIEEVTTNPNEDIETELTPTVVPFEQ